MARSGPLVLLVDDLQWLDEASAGLLHYVARVTSGQRVAIACATREGELDDNPAALRFVRALRRDGRLTVLPLAPLGERDTAALVWSAVGPSVDGARVFRESGGNPLFAIEVARALAGGAHDGPQALEALLEERLARLGARAREIVVWAAALGREFDPEILAAVAGESLAQTAGAVGELERDGLVSGSGARTTFTHDLVRQAAYRQLSGARRRLVHLTIARTLAASPDPGAAWGDVVHHASLADDHALAARACVAAGDRALRMLARRPARDFVARGLAHVGRVGPEGLPVRLELLKIAALATAMDDARQLAFEENAERAVREAEELGRPELAAQALFAIGFFRSTRGDFEGTHPITLGAAEASRAASPAERLPTLANSALCLAFIERELPKARALLDEATEIARGLRTPVADIELGEGYLSHIDGDVSRARGALERGLALGRARADAWRQSMALIRLAMIELESGAWAATQARAAELREVSVKLGEGSEGAIAEALGALAAQGKGDAGAVDRVTAAVEELARVDAKAMLAYALTTAAEMAAARGAFDDARALGGRALEAALPLGKPSAIVLAHAVLGHAALGLGEADEAAAHLSQARELLDHPYGVSRRAREAVERLGRISNAGTNPRTHATGTDTGTR
jgi:tetratricopeptide (TPR) repeat protein